jgi:hypothetical protein
MLTDLQYGIQQLAVSLGHSKHGRNEEFHSKELKAAQLLINNY